MIIHRVLDHLFSAQSTVKVLRVLYNNVIGLTGREIANISGLNHQSAHNALANLETLKLIKRVIGGITHIFTLNRKNYLVKELIVPLFNSELEFQNQIISITKKYLKNCTVSSILFGSVARKDETASSDFDLCIVFDTNKKVLEEKVNSLSEILYKEFGVTLAPFYIKTEEFQKRAKRNKPPINEIIKEGMVISGKSIKELL